MKGFLNKVSVCFESKSYIHISLAFLWLFMIYQAYLGVTLNKQLNVQQSQFVDISGRIASDKEQINVLVTDSQSTYQTVKGLEKSVANLSKRLEEVQQYQLEQVLNKSREDDSKPSFDDINNLQGQISTLQFQLKGLQQKLYDLNKNNITAAVNAQNSSNTPLKVITESQYPTKKPAIKPLIPPFAILGIESRGGELFVAVAPSKSANLNQIKLLRTGDSYRSWQLKSIRTNAAVFSVGSHQQIINIR